MDGSQQAGIEQKCGVTSALDPGLLFAAGELACGCWQQQALPRRRRLGLAIGQGGGEVENKESVPAASRPPPALFRPDLLRTFLPLYRSVADVRLTSRSGSPVSVGDGCFTLLLERLRV
jgi:hypothetical protein